MISLYDFLNAANGQLFGEPAAQLFTNFCLDPYLADSSTLFVALQTPRGNTDQYIEEAIQRGAGGVVCTHPPDCETDGVSVVMVRDPFDAMIAWSKYILKKYTPHIVAVSGSSAKSVAVKAIAHLLSQKYGVHGGDIDVSGLLNIPLSLANMRPDDEYLVLKFDVEKPGDMADLLEIASPDIAVICHIDCYHPSTFTSCNQLLDEYRMLVKAVPEQGLVVLNADDAQAAELAETVTAPVRTVAMDVFGADLMAYNILTDTARTGFDLRFGSERFVARWIPLLGKFHLYSALAALAVGQYAGVPLDRGLRALTKLTPIAGRLSPLRGTGGAALIDDSYSANMISTHGALEWLSDVKYEHQAVVILGDMDDLADHTQLGHRAVGIQAAQVADVLITLGAQAAQAARSAVDHGMDSQSVFSAYSVEEVLNAVRRYHLTKDDIVLIKGGREARMEHITRALLDNPEDEPNTVRYMPQVEETDEHPGSQTLYTSWIEVDTAILGDNIGIIRNMLADHVTLCAVIKADAYGHGAVATAHVALQSGATYLAVASMTEALELRDAGIEAPILILTYTPLHAIRQAVRSNLTVTIFDLEQARAYDRAVRDMRDPLKYHVKVDTGMGRMGVLARDALHMFRYLAALSHMQLEGIYTHFSVADEDLDFTREQVAQFKRVVQAVRASGFDVTYAHCANSAGVLQGPEFHMDMVRPGVMMYGMAPAPGLQLPPGINPALSWKTTVLQVKTLPAGHNVGYGNAYTTQETEKIAILPVGYADGLRRSPRSWQSVLIRGQRAPLIGRVSMEKATVSVQHIAGVVPGDEVVLLGSQGDDAITADEVARWLGTINYEVVTNILRHVPRTIS
ncbi:alanine racemase [Phototrophicus methaneseepsis]|uniref:Alanine racemase n=1 Tax=Phototrophicus methaneseepsis TaxID=2710758 RepID=A0A7S8E7J7_9CHLR|nr:alanine racemase [Phototrophicus methaneseepsis]QPC81799.1 alanine racemase [Phototrophicus methaneseepsis]